MLRFRDLDCPEFMQFILSPAFATYILMRRYVWRSKREHYMGLHEHYRNGLLTCSLERARIADMLGGVSERKISNDLEFLLRQGVVKTIRTGRQNIYILGEWVEKEGAYAELWYLDSITINNVDNSDSDFPKDGELTRRNVQVGSP